MQYHYAYCVVGNKLNANKCISKNIRTLIAEGKPHEQAVAIALNLVKK